MFKLGAAWCALALLALQLSAATNTDDSVVQSNDISLEPLVVGGNEASPRAYPWLGALSQAGSTSVDGQFCGSSLISPNHVVTAAHCFFDDNGVQTTQPGDVVVDLNRHNLNIRVGTGSESSAIRRSVSKISVHPSYRHSQSSDYDVAVLTLSQSVDNIQPVALATSALYPSSGTMCRVAGWGDTSDGAGTGSSVLNTAQVPVTSTADCKNAYGSSAITANMICAGYIGQGGIDTCQGDSGGPLFVEENGSTRVVGVSSFGDECGSKWAPGVYARVGTPNVKSFINGIVGQAPPQSSTPAPTPTPTPSGGGGGGGGGTTDDPMYCAPGCHWDMVGDGSCDPQCQTSNCYDDVDDCAGSASSGGGASSGNDFDCAPGCPADYLGDGICDDTCYTDNCSFDLGDCDAILAEKNSKKTGFRLGSLSTAASIALIMGCALVIGAAIAGFVIRKRRATGREQRARTLAQQQPGLNNQA